MKSVADCPVNGQTPFQNHRMLCGFTEPVWEALAARGSVQAMATGAPVSSVSAGMGAGRSGGRPPSRPPLPQHWGSPGHPLVSCGLCCWEPHTALTPHPKVPPWLLLQPAWVTVSPRGGTCNTSLSVGKGAQGSAQWGWGPLPDPGPSSPLRPPLPRGTPGPVRAVTSAGLWVLPSEPRGSQPRAWPGVG